MHELSRADARRIAVRAQLLTADRPADLLDTVRRLTLLQTDITRYVVPSPDLVLWSRLGASYEPQHLRDAVDEQRIIELNSMLRPAEDIALFRAEMSEWPGSGELKDWEIYRRDWVRANDDCRHEILQRLREDGPLPANELPDTCVVPWQSSGWNANRNRSRMLDMLAQRGEIAVAGGLGTDKLWDLAERVYPDDPILPQPEARRILDERQLRALGISRAGVAAQPGEPRHVSEAGEPAVVDGVRGKWRVAPELLGQPFTGRVALLSPLDRLVVDRKRLHELFDFDYQLEMYKPAHERIWGYWALPILAGDRFVGKLDAKAEHDEGLLQVNAIHLDVEVDEKTERAINDEIDALAAWLGLEVGARSG